MLRRYVAAPAALALAGLVMAAAPVEAQTRRAQVFTVVMTGEEEAPNPGDADGIGLARFTIIPSSDTICYVLFVTGIAPATAAHIHIAPPGVAGPIVVGLSPPTRGVSAACVVSPHADAIAADPGAYYVNVHNAPFPSGAIRGQLA